MPVEPPASPWSFPGPERFDPADDLVAAGADLAPGTLLAAYRNGIFPMPVGATGEPMYWWSPVRRGVLPVHGMRVSRSLRRSARDLEIRVDTAFAEVLEACADTRRDSGWIDDGIRSAYLRLHELGWVHSVEAWRGAHLVGGLYGIAIGGLFAGESMFHHKTDGSKAAVAGLVELLSDKYAADRVFDIQWVTSHLATLGAIAIPREQYLRRVERALALPLPDAFS